MINHCFQNRKITQKHLSCLSCAPCTIKYVGSHVVGRSVCRSVGRLVCWLIFWSVSCCHHQCRHCRHCHPHLCPCPCCCRCRHRHHYCRHCRRRLHCLCLLRCLSWLLCNPWSQCSFCVAQHWGLHWQRFVLARHLGAQGMADRGVDGWSSKCNYDGKKRGRREVVRCCGLGSAV